MASWGESSSSVSSPEGSSTLNSTFESQSDAPIKMGVASKNFNLDPGPPPAPSATVAATHRRSELGPYRGPRRSMSQQAAPLLLPANYAPCSKPMIVPSWRPVKKLDTKQHRHSKPLGEGMNLLKAFANRTDRCDAMGVPQSGLDCIQKQGWDYHGQVHGVRLYSKAGDQVVEDAACFRYPEGDDIFLTPYIRAEGWVQGDWNVPDIIATIRSIGARSLWDERIDNKRSSYVELLNGQDWLVHVTMKNLPPMGDRDLVLATTYAENCDGSVGYVVHRSVEDKLVPPQANVHRGITHLQGWILRKFDEPPYPDDLFEQNIIPMGCPTLPPNRRFETSAILGSSLPSPIEEELEHMADLQSPTPGDSSSSPLSSTPLRRQSSLNSTFSSYSNFSFGSKRNGSSSSTLSSRSSLSSISEATKPRSNRRSSLQALGISTSSDQHRSSTSRRTSPTTPSGATPVQRWTPHKRSYRPPKKPGLHLSFIGRLQPGGPIPITFMNTMSLKSGLAIEGLGRYLNKYGFAPHICTRSREVGDILAEDFDPIEGRYQVTYRARERIEGEITKIRFHGATFGGRFNIEVLRAPEFWVEFENPPDSGPNPRKSFTTTGENLSRKSSMTFSSSPPQRRPSSLVNDPESTEETADLSKAVGPQGACTLCLRDTLIGVPIQVCITKAAEKAKVRHVRKASNALAQAIKVSSQGWGSASVEALSRKLSNGEDPERGLATAREVLRTLGHAEEDGGTPESGSSPSIMTGSHSLSDPSSLLVPSQSPKHSPESPTAAATHYRTRTHGSSGESKESGRSGSSTRSSLLGLSYKLGPGRRSGNSSSATTPPTPYNQTPETPQEEDPGGGRHGGTTRFQK